MQNKPSLNKIFIILFLILFLATKNYAQNFDKIKKSDTIYVFFKKDLFKQMTMPQKKGYGDYIFIFNEFYKYNHIIFYHTPLTPEKKTEKKSFLQKNKDLIINYNFLINMFSYDDAKKLLFNKKKIYLIDYDEIGLFSIKLKEVKAMDYSHLNSVE